MSDQEKIQLLTEIFGSPFSQGKEILFYCPKCKHHKKKLSFNLEKNFFKCWTCDWSSKSINWAVHIYGNSSQLKKWEELSGRIDFSNKNQLQWNNPEETQPRIKLPKEFMTLTNKTITPLSIPARNFLRDRGVTQDDINWWKMGYCVDGNYAHRILIPSFDMSGYVNYFVARKYIEYGPNYLNPPIPKDIIFNELYLDWKKDITLVEGVFDAVVAGNAIPLLGSSLREDSDLFKNITSKCSKIYTALDPDAYKKENEIIKLILQYGIDILKIEVTPYGDVGEMTKKEFQNRKNNAISIIKDNEFMYVLKTIKL